MKAIFWTWRDQIWASQDIRHFSCLLFFLFFWHRCHISVWATHDSVSAVHSSFPLFFFCFLSQSSNLKHKTQPLHYIFHMMKFTITHIAEDVIQLKHRLSVNHYFQSTYNFILILYTHNLFIINQRKCTSMCSESVLSILLFVCAEEDKKKQHRTKTKVSLGM